MSEEQNNNISRDENNRMRTRVRRNGKIYEARPVEYIDDEGNKRTIIKMVEYVVTEEILKRREESIKRMREEREREKFKKSNKNFISLF